MLSASQPPLEVSYRDLGQGVNPATVRMQANGAALQVACTPTDVTARCTPHVSLADGVVTLTATVQDYAGNTSLPATLRITVDTVPPLPPNLGQLTVGPVSNGQVMVTGAVGSVEGGATVTITNPRTGETETVTANADGSFTAQLAAQAGDQLSVVVTDAAGNTSPAGQLPVGPPPDPVDIPFRAIWDGMNRALLAGDKATALTYLTPSAQVKYGPVFDALLPHMAEIIASYLPLQRVAVAEDMGEYAVTRLSDGQLHLFLIYFLKDEAGVWKLEAM